MKVIRSDLIKAEINGAMVAADFFSPQISILLLHIHRQQRYKYASVGEKMPILCGEKI